MKRLVSVSVQPDGDSPQLGRPDRRNVAGDGNASKGREYDGSIDDADENLDPADANERPDYRLSRPAQMASNVLFGCLAIAPFVLVFHAWVVMSADDAGANDGPPDFAGFCAIHAVLD